MATSKKVTSKKEPASPIKVTRSELRDRLLGHAPKPRRTPITLFGQEIELQQPTLRAILEAQNIDDMKLRSTGMIIEYAYVPGTNERIFEPADREMILNWPFNNELVELQMAIAELTGISAEDVQNQEAELKTDPLGGQS